jgi:heptosyltransferase-2
MKIGLIRLSSLGDVVLATSCLKPVCEAHPGCEIIFITKSEFSGVFNNNPYLNGVIAWSESEPFKGLLARVRAERFDFLVDLHSTPRSRSITAFSGAKKTATYKKSHIARRLSVVRKKKLKTRHVIDRYMDALKPLGVKTGDTLPAIYPGAEDAGWVDLFLAEQGYSGGPLVVVAPGGRKRTKRWPAPKYSRLASSLVSELGATVVIIGDEGDLDISAQIGEGNPGVIDGIAKTSIGKLGALVSRSDLVVSNDSAPVHFAVASGTPVIAIFGPTIGEFGFAPYGAGHFVVEKELYCRPCSLHGTDTCPEGHHRCMEEIEWTEVFEIAAHLLKPDG